MEHMLLSEIIWADLDLTLPRNSDLQTCSNDSQALSDQTLNFIRGHPLMDHAVPAFGGAPILTQASFKWVCLRL